MEKQDFGTQEKRISLSDFGKGVLKNSAVFAVAALMSSSSQTELFSPLGIAFCSGTDKKRTLFACLGAMLGYMLSNDYLTAFRYIMALLIVCILKTYISYFKALASRALTGALISLFAIASTGVVVTVTSEFSLQALGLRCAEAATAFGGAYVFAVAFSCLPKLAGEEKLGQRELIFAVTAALTVTASLSRISLFGVTASGIACSFAVMCCAYIFGESGGAVIGTGAALGLMMCGNGSPAAFGFSAAGLIAGIFSYSGRVLCAMAYIFSYSSAMLIFGLPESAAAPFIETAVASVAFILTPQKALFRLKIKVEAGYSGGEAVKSMMSSRLKMIKSAVLDMSGTVARVAEILKEKAPPDTAGVYLRVRDNVCAGCASYESCWGREFSQTAEDFDLLLEEIRQKGKVTPSGAPAKLQSRCIRIMSLCDSFNKNYSSYCARLGAEGRINEMRKITADQYETVCDMLGDMLSELETGARPLAERSRTVQSGLSQLGERFTVNCYEDSNMNLTVSVFTDGEVNEEAVKKQLEAVTEKRFDMPAVTCADSETVLLFWEKPKYSAECVYFQLSGSEGEICGDCFESFYDGKGCFVALLSDGMGTGGRAAVDGAMTASLLSRLIVAGFSFPCAIKLVNSAMLVKSNEESLATLDILKINLYTGQAVIYKAGAAVSLLKRQGKVSELKKSAMPIGILRQAQFATIKGNLYDGDTIVLMSDGATDSASAELAAALRELPFTYDLPEKLCTVAKSRCHGEKRDDITVAAIRLKLNPAE